MRAELVAAVLRAASPPPRRELIENLDRAAWRTFERLVSGMYRDERKYADIIDHGGEAG